MSESRISNSTAIISTIVSTLGSGITLMPAVFNKFGTLYSLCLMAGIGLITFISLYFLAYAADATTTKSENKPSSYSYEGIAANFSSTLKICVSVALVLSSLATAFSFVQTLMNLIIQSLAFNQTFSDSVLRDNLSPEAKQNESMMLLALVRLGILFILALLYYPLFKLESLTSLDVFSKLSLGCCILFSCVTFGYGIFAPYDFEKFSAEGEKLPKADVGSAIGYIIFALHCQFSFPGIISAMKDQSLANFRKITLVSSITATILYSLVGYFGYRGFGYPIAKNGLISAFGNKNSSLAISLSERFSSLFGVYLPRFIQTAYIPIFFSGIVFNIFAVIPILQNFIKVKGKPVSRNTLALVLSTLVIASGFQSVENIDLLFGIIGFLFVAPLSFLFPALFVVKCTKKFNLMKIVSYAMLALSIAIMIGLSVDTIQKQLKGN